MGTIAELFKGDSAAKTAAAQGNMTQQPPSSIADIFRQGGLSGDVGMTTTPTEALDRAPEIQQLQTQGVDTHTGGDAGIRASLSLREFDPESQDEFLKKEFGEGNFRKTPAGIVIKDAGGEYLLDEEGFTVRDFADIIDEGIVTTGAVVGALAAGPALAGSGIVSLAGISAVAAIVGQGFASTKDIIVALKDGRLDGDKLMQIAKDRGVKAAIDFGIDALTVGAARLARSTAQVAVGPFAHSVPQAEQNLVAKAAEETGETLTAAERTGSESLARGEAIARKAPGGGGPFDRLDQENAAIVQRGIDRIIPNAPDSEVVGAQAVAALSRQSAASDNAVKVAREELDRGARARIAGFGDSIHKPAPGEELDLTTAATGVRTKLVARRDEARATDTVNFNAVHDHPAATGDLVKSANIKKSAQDLINELPTETRVVNEAGDISTDPAKAFAPGSARKFLESIVHLDDMSLKQAIAARARLGEMIKDGDALSGVSQGALKKLSMDFTEAMKQAQDSVADPELKALLAKANDFHKNEVLKFGERGPAALFKPPTVGGAVEDENVLVNLFLKDRRSELNRVAHLVGVDSTEFKQARRAVFDHIMVSAQDNLHKSLMDPIKLFNSLNKMSPETRRILFGTRQEMGVDGKLLTIDVGEEIMDAARHSANARGKIDIGVLKGETNDMAKALRDATAKEIENRKLFNNKVIKPFLEGDADASTINADEFVRHMLDSGSASDFKKVFALIGPNSQLATDIRKRTVMELLERSRESSSDVIAEMAGTASPVGKNLSQKMMKVGGSDKDVSRRKLVTILGEDITKTLESFGIVAAARERKSASAGAAGGLIAGSIMAGIAKKGPMALPEIIKYRVIAGILTFPAGRKWLGQLTRIPTVGGRGSAVAIAGRDIISQAIDEEFKEEPELLRGVKNFLGI